jgi:hypothetical protein
MSQNSAVLKTAKGRSVRVTVGFDPRLQTLFSNALPLDADDSEDYTAALIFEADSLDTLVAGLAQAGLTLPVEMIEQTYLDQVFAVGNVCRTFKSDGQLDHVTVF